MVTNGQVVNAKDAMQRLVNRQDIPAKYHINVLRFAREFGNELTDINNARNTIIVRWAEEGKNEVTVENPHYEECIKEVSALMLEESKLSKTIKIPGTVVKDGETKDLYIDTVDLLMLEPFVEIG